MDNANLPDQVDNLAETAMPRLADLGDAPDEFQPMRLILQPGGLVLELKNPDLIVGRHSEADLRLPLPDVSRRHCRFFFTGTRWLIQDLKSLNGIYVNDEMIGETTLHNGDTLRIGSYTFSVELPETAEGAKNMIRRLMQDMPRTKPSSRIQQRRAS